LLQTLEQCEKKKARMHQVIEDRGFLACDLSNMVSQLCTPMPSTFEKTNETMPVSHKTSNSEVFEKKTLMERTHRESGKGVTTDHFPGERVTK